MFVGSLVIGGMSVLWTLASGHSPKSALLKLSSSNNSNVCAVVDRATNRVTLSEGPVAEGISARKVGSRGTRVLVAPEGTTLADSSPRGRLCDQLNFWKFMAQCGLILGVVREGYRIPLFLEPPARQFSNNKSDFLHSDFVTNEISSLLLKGCITELAEGQLPKVVNPLSVSQNLKGKLRLILDLRHINQFLHKHKFKLEHP